MTDPYEVLNIPSTATDEEVKKAYRDLARKYHPDNYHDNPLADLAQEKMKEINAAYHTIQQNFQDLGVDESHYDRIITGDLGEVGSKILLDMMKQAGSDLTGVHMDCGMEIYEKETQDTHAGGSGCGCAAVTLCSLILPRIRSGEWKRVLYLPTGALLSTVSFNEGESIPGICHGVVLETCQ